MYFVDNVIFVYQVCRCLKFFLFDYIYIVKLLICVFMFLVVMNCYYKKRVMN